MSSIELREHFNKKRKKDSTVDLMLEIIPGNPGEIVSKHGVLRDLKENIKDAKRAFIGKPRVCHEIVKSIIHLRRGIEVEYHTEKFYSLLDKYQDVLISEFDTRWLISLCDTIVDTGNDADSSSAMTVVLIVNGLNIQAILLEIAGANQPSRDQVRNTSGRKTWDGMLSAFPTKGDMVFNMMTRAEKNISRSALVLPIWQEIKNRFRDDLSIPVNWLMDAHDNEKDRKFFR
jgi:hypothetical protein